MRLFRCAAPLYGNNATGTEILSAKSCGDLSHKQFTAHSYPVIGRHFGNRDHTTIMHSVKTVER